MAARPRGSRKPPTRVYKRGTIAHDEPNRSGNGFSEFGDQNIPYGKLPELPANGGEGGVVHQYKRGNKHASLTMGDGKGGLIESTRFEFWCIGVSYGFGSGGSSAQSKMYQAYYAKSFSNTPISIKGRVPNDKYKEDMYEWIRSSQINLARGEPRVRLEIPAANIVVWGYIPSISAGQTAGFEPAPEMNFDFVVTRNARKDVDRQGSVSQMVIAYFLDPKDTYWGRVGPNGGQIDIGEAYDALESEARAAFADQKAVKTFGNLFDKLGF